MSDNSKYIILTEDNFQSEVLDSSVAVLVDFWAEWCGPCRALAPAIEELAVSFDGRAKVGKLNVDDHQGIAMRYGIRSIPTLLFFKDGEPVDQVVGVLPPKEIQEKLEALVDQTVEP